MPLFVLRYVLHAGRTFLLILGTGISCLANASDATAFFSSDSQSGSALISGDRDFLDVDDAFKLNLRSTASGYLLEWSIAPDYYLYKRQFKIELLEGEELTPRAQFSRGLQKIDGYFGLVEVYYHSASAELIKPQSVASTVESDNISQFIKVQYQGCADAGLCYPTQTREIRLPH